MQRNWTQRMIAWLQGEQNQAVARRSRSQGRYDGNRRGAMISLLEVLESRQLLTNLVAVTVDGGAVSLTDKTSHKVTTGDSFDVSYTGSQVVLTGHNGTMFQVGGQTLSTYTATVTSPISLNMRLNPHGNTVTVTGDGTADLSSLGVHFGSGNGSNSLTLTKVVADSVTVDGGARHNNIVTLNQSTVNHNLNANLGRQASDSLDLENTTVKGNVDVRLSQFIVNHSTITGTLTDVENRRNSTFTSTASTYTGAVSVRMGRDGVINMLGSVDGPNHFHSSETVTGRPHFKTTLNEAQNAVVNDVPPKLKYVNVVTMPVTVGTPTVTSLTAVKNTPTISGTFDSTKAPLLSVAANGKTYKLGTDAQLTSPSAGKWSLDLTGAPLPAGTTTVTATNADSSGDTAQGTGTVTTSAQVNAELPIIHKYETTNNLTAKETNSGLNYVITTPGTGAVPTAGQTLTVNYTGHILNADGTLGTEFDSNIDPQFNHVTPFTFKLGTGAVIKGWDEAFALLPVGTVAKLIIPSPLGYGTTGSGTSIPANSILVFDVTLVSAV